MKWKIGACGEYAEYKGYTIIKQDHPELLKYEICFSLDDHTPLKHIALANTLKECKEIIKGTVE